MSNPELIIRLGETPANKEEAISIAAKLLSEAGCIPYRYVESMQQREKTDNTFLGSGVAIPHGELSDKNMVRKDGLAVIQAPKGVKWGKDDIATLIVAIAAKTDSHIDILTQLTGIMMNKDALKTINSTTDVNVIRSLLLNSKVENKNPSQPEDDYSEAIKWRVDYPSGLHARPASVWVEKAKAAGIPMKIRNKNKIADPCSLVSLLHLNVKLSDTLIISAEGKNAKEVLKQFHSDISALTASEKSKLAKVSKRVTLRAWTPNIKEIQSANVIGGVAAAPGLAIGNIYYLDSPEIEVPDIPGDLIKNGATLEHALKTTKLELKELFDDTAKRLSKSEAEIFYAQAELLEDEELLSLSCRLIAQGHGVAWSWQQAVDKQAHELSQSETALLASRAIDLRDVGLRVLKILAPELKFTNFPFPDKDNIIIAAKDLTPSDTATIDTNKVVGLATAEGGSTSHTAILARTIGLAAVVAAGSELFTAKDGDTIIIDGDGGRIWLNPSTIILEAAKKEIQKRNINRKTKIKRRTLTSKTSDGQRIKIAANINTPDQALLALEMGAEEVGLMRTEFLFIEKNKTPSEEEQFEIYCAMAKNMNGKNVIIRALDIGGDKPVAHLNLAGENNPFLGVRGSRLLLRRLDLFEPQLRALYRAAKEYSNISVMFPMVTSVSEVLEIKKICQRIRKEINAPKIKLGIMIEVPAAAIMSDLFAKHVDFISIGTNDLTQYTLAMDRQNPELAAEVDCLHPGVLRMIQHAVSGAKKYNCPVGVCGSIAGDPQGAAILIGLGVSELSMTPREIPVIKDLILEHNKSELTKLAQKALTMDNADQVCDEFQEMFAFV